MKLLIHSQNSTLRLLKFGIGYVIFSSAFNFGCNYLSKLRLKLIHFSKRSHWNQGLGCINISSPILTSVQIHKLAVSALASEVISKNWVNLALLIPGYYLQDTQSAWWSSVLGCNDNEQGSVTWLSINVSQEQYILSKFCRLTSL